MLFLLIHRRFKSDRDEILWDSSQSKYATTDRDGFLIRRLAFEICRCIHSAHLVRQQSVQDVQCESKHPTRFSAWHFPKWLGIFSPNFTCLLSVLGMILLNCIMILIYISNYWYLILCWYFLWTEHEVQLTENTEYYQTTKPSCCWQTRATLLKSGSRVTHKGIESDIIW